MSPTLAAVAVVAVLGPPGCLALQHTSALPTAMMYLMKYGYMDMPSPRAQSAPLLSQDYLRDYIREFQVRSVLARLKVPVVRHLVDSLKRGSWTMQHWIS